MIGRALTSIARQGRVVLVLGLVAGTLMPGLARALEPVILPGVAVLLFLAALRIGPVAIRLSRAEWGREAIRAAVLQTALPLTAFGVLAALGVETEPVALAVVLTLTAPPVTGTPGLAILVGAAPAVGLRAVAVCTALLPLTALPVFWVLPALGDAGALGASAVRLLAIVAVAASLAFALRAALPAVRAPGAAPLLDGAITGSLALVVIPMMAEVGPALLAPDRELAITAIAAFGICLGTQMVAYAACRRMGDGADAPARAIGAGCRNLAVVFASLDPAVQEPLFLFLGLWQVPMLMTPLIMRRFYRV